jgi:hypothetical protein
VCKKKANQGKMHAVNLESRRKAMRKDAPKELRRLVDKIKQKEAHIRDDARAHRECTNANREVVRALTQYRTNGFRNMMALRRLKRELSMYAFPSFVT